MCFSKQEILDQIKDYLGFSTDKEFSEYLGIKPNTLSNWKKRGTYDAELLYTKCDFLNAGVLLGAEGVLIETKREEINIPQKGKEKGKDISNNQKIQKNLPFVNLLSNSSSNRKIEDKLINSLTEKILKKVDLSLNKQARKIDLIEAVLGKLVLLQDDFDFNIEEDDLEYKNLQESSRNLDNEPLS